MPYVVLWLQLTWMAYLLPVIHFTFWLLDRTGNASTVKTTKEIQEHEKV